LALSNPTAMATLASRPLAELHAAPDHSIGSPDAKAKPPQAMHLEMDAKALELLLACTRRGKPAQVVFGRNPVRMSACLLLLPTDHS
jgi:hypothetical protein